MESWFGMTPQEIVDSGDKELAVAWVNHHSRGDWFTGRLFRLWQTADFSNKARLRTGFPDEVELFEIWLEQ